MGGTLRKMGIVLGLLTILALFLVSVNAVPKFLPNMNPFQQDESFNLKDLKFSFEIPEMPPVIGWMKKSDYLIVTTAPSNVEWSNVDKGDSHCIVPTGIVMSGDKVLNCQGTIILRWNPTNSLLGTWEFGSRSNSNNNDNNQNIPTSPPTVPEEITDPIPEQPTTSDQEEEQNNNNENNTTEENNENDTTSEIPEDTSNSDITQFIDVSTINIKTPKTNHIYFRNNEKIKTFTTIVISDIEIETIVDSTNMSNVTGVKFYVDGEHYYTDETYPYKWTYDEKAFFIKTTITVTVLDKSGYETAYDEVDFIYLNLGIL